MKFKYVAYAAPCCMALTGSDMGLAVACMTTMFLAFVLEE